MLAYQRVASACCLMGTVLVAAALAGASEPARIPREGYKPPDFTLKTLDGRDVILYKLLKESSVVLVVLRGYPGYQCPICSVQVGDLLKNADRFAKANTKVVLVYPGPQEALAAKAAEFLKNRELPEHFLFVTDPDYAFTNDYGLRWDAPRETAYPAALVIDRQGTVRFVKVSKTHGDRAAADELLKFVPGAD